MWKKSVTASFLCTCTVRGQNELHAQEVNLSVAVSATLSDQQSATKKEREERKSLTRIKQRSEDGSSATSCHTDLSVQSWDSCVCVSVWYHPAIKVRLSVTLSPDCFQSHRFAVWSTVRLKPNELSVCKVQILSCIWRNLCLRKFDHLAPLNSN